MKKRLIEIIKELKEAERESGIAGFYVSNNVVFQEACSCWRGEQMKKQKQIYKPKQEIKINPTKKATEKQIAYVQQLADEKKKDLKLTGNETSLEVSKMIESLKNNPNGKTEI